MKKVLLLLLLAAGTVHISQAQSLPGSSSIYHQLQKLATTPRVLYLAAHPDDENTRIISWLENHQHVRTAYLSLTRGSGGQNLIGSELGAQLGVLRTQELMQARAIDGGEQYFSRAVDFGYSKTAEETLEFWDKDKILSDVVWVIRKFRPDVIITRFPADARGGHGHHTASAVLALEAFDIAGKETAYPEQLEYVQPWQPKRIFWNHSTWWNQNLDSIAQANPDYTVVEVGEYNPVLGFSTNELASFSRTQHKSQGFGVSVDRGSVKEYLQLLKGEKLDGHIFDGINTGWARYGWPEGDELMQRILENYDVSNPAASIPALMKFWEASQLLAQEDVRRDLNRQLQNLMAQMLGLHVELTATKEYLTQGEEVQLNLRAIKRAAPALELSNIRLNAVDFPVKKDLPQNQEVNHEVKATVFQENSQPYWLQSPYRYIYQVDDQELIGLPENDPALTAQVYFRFKKGDAAFMLEVPAVYKTTDRVEGEVKKPLMVTPAYTVNLSSRNLIFVDEHTQTVNLDIKAFEPGTLRLGLAAQGWEVEPAQSELHFSEAGQERSLQVSIRPKGESTKTAVLQVLQSTDVSQNAPVYSINEIGYQHIDKRVVFEPANLKLVKIPLRKTGQRVGYIPGAGDEVMEALELMGYQVDLLDEAALKTADLSKYQAVVAGIRAYNTQPWLPAMRPKLMAYVEQGGNYIVQYNTRSRDLLTNEIGPYPFEISRERVTEEDAAPTFLEPQSPVLNYPNNITAQDFDGWVQERGLYFAGEWDERYHTPIGWNDTGEPMRKGGLLLANHGDGAFIYTGISFFREVPAGVEGAFRLLANLISYAQNGENE